MSITYVSHGISVNKLKTLKMKNIRVQYKIINNKKYRKHKLIKKENKI